MSLSSYQAWHYFHASDQAAALVALRARMGTSYATAPSDGVLLAALGRAVELVHRATGRWFLKRTGQLSLDGLGAARLWLPHPVISTGQGGTGVSELIVGTVDDDAVDAADYVVHDGADDVGDGDPRDNPWIELSSSSAIWPSLWGAGKFPEGTRNVHVTATWGYVEADGTTPALILDALARLVILEATPLDDLDGQEDRIRGALSMEQTQGRSYMIDRVGMSAGVTRQGVIDRVLASYKRPPEVRIARPDKRMRSRDPGRGWR